MNNNGWMSFLFVVLALVIVCLSTYLALSPQGTLAFLAPVASFNLIVPLTLIFLSLIMFVAGFHYHKAMNVEHEIKKSEEERELVKHLVTKIEMEKVKSE